MFPSLGLILKEGGLKVGLKRAKRKERREANIIQNGGDTFSRAEACEMRWRTDLCVRSISACEGHGNAGSAGGGDPGLGGIFSVSKRVREGGMFPPWTERENYRVDNVGRA